MKNIIVSLLIFIFTLSFIIFANHKLNNLCDFIAKNCNTILEELPSDDWDDIQATSQKLINKIEDCKLLTSIYINHNDYDTLNHEALKLYYFIYTRDKTEAYAATAILKSYSEKVKDLSKPTIENIL